MKLDRDTYGTVLLIYLLCAAGVAALFCLVSAWWIKWPLSLALLWVALWQTYFHMVPARTPVGNDRLVTAVSDGVVVKIWQAYEPLHLRCEAIVVSIYMDFWDLHANFWPVTGTVSYTAYFPGKHLLAFKPKASEENEHWCTAVRTAAGREILFKQMAGGFARRIVCHAEEGQAVSAGSQCGIIKFGSRIDLYLPLDAELLVKEGDKVRAVTSPVARL